LNHCPRLTSLPASLAASLTSLVQLSLRHSQLQQIPAELESLFARLTQLDLTGSRVHCNCSLLWLTRLLRSAFNRSLSSPIEWSAPTCSAASELSGLSLLELSESHLNCDLLQPTLFAFCALVVALLLLGGAAFVCYALFSLLRRRSCLDSIANKCQLSSTGSATPVTSLTHLFRRHPNLYTSSLAAGANAFGTDPKRTMKMDATHTWLPSSTTSALFANSAGHCSYPAQLTIGSLLGSSADSTVVSGLSNAYEVVSLSGSTTGNNVYSPASLDSTYLGHNYASLYETCGPARPPTAVRQAPPPYLHSWNPSFDEQVGPLIGASTLINNPIRN
jgi:hypothetical protein